MTEAPTRLMDEFSLLCAGLGLRLLPVDVTICLDVCWESPVPSMEECRRDPAFQVAGTEWNLTFQRVRGEVRYSYVLNRLHTLDDGRIRIDSWCEMGILSDAAAGVLLAKSLAAGVSITDETLAREIRHRTS